MSETRIIELRTQRGWTQERLAEASGVTVRTVQRLEAGNDVSLDTLSRLGKALGVAVRDLFVTVPENDYGKAVSALDETEARTFCGSSADCLAQYWFSGSPFCRVAHPGGAPDRGGRSGRPFSQRRSRDSHRPWQFLLDRGGRRAPAGSSNQRSLAVRPDPPEALAVRLRSTAVGKRPRCDPSTSTDHIARRRRSAVGALATASHGRSVAGADPIAGAMDSRRNSLPPPRRRRRVVHGSADGLVPLRRGETSLSRAVTLGADATDACTELLS
ncbi:helix-turn-helix transcriptional regulator [Microbacterium hatanonis]|uniref:Helix-turn-helix transcriptional regulator n=1 Tax=Microbacterium hatanonis TaxID=404366 RepID=A0A5C8I1W0_9MICO|nr:helix-turn-helix transcriptional regulator [Microbacterium hatanonis]